MCELIKAKDGFSAYICSHEDLNATGDVVETKTGARGKTRYKDELINGKRPVKMHSGENLLCDPDSLTVLSSWGGHVCNTSGETYRFNGYGEHLKESLIPDFELDPEGHKDFMDKNNITGGCASCSVCGEPYRMPRF